MPELTSNSEILQEKLKKLIRKGEFISKLQLNTKRLLAYEKLIKFSKTYSDESQTQLKNISPDFIQNF